MEPIEAVGAATPAAESPTSASSEVSAVATAGVGFAVADASGSTGVTAIAGTLVAAAGCGALTLRGLRRA